MEDVAERFSDIWDEQAQATEFCDDEDADDLHDLGRALVEKYMREGAPLVQPQAVQLPVEGEIGGVKVRGRIDLVDEQGGCDRSENRKQKTSGDLARLSSATHHLRCSLSSELSCGRLDIMVKTKTVRLVRQTLRIARATCCLQSRSIPWFKTQLLMASSSHDVPRGYVRVATALSGELARRSSAGP